MRGHDRSLCGQEQGLKMWNLWVVNRGDRRREWKKLANLVESRVDAEAVGRLSGLLLSQRVVYVYDILPIGQGRELGQLAPMCCCFWGFLSI